MATLYITEFTNVGSFGLNGNGIVQIAAMPPNAQQTVGIATTSVVSSVFAQGTQLIRLNTDTSCSVAFVTGTGTATTTMARMATNQTEYFTVPLNASYKVAVLANT